MTASPADPLTIVVASPLEPVLVDRIRRFDPGRFRIIHEPDLLPAPRYVADHSGAPRSYSEAERRRWDEILATADILFDFDLQDPATLPARAPRLKWVQATSAGIGEFLERTGLRNAPITYTTAAGVHARSLAEFALLGLLHFFRGMPHLTAVKRDHHWERYTVRGLEGARMLVVGLGSVGREIAVRCSQFGVEVWGTAAVRTDVETKRRLWEGVFDYNLSDFAPGGPDGSPDAAFLEITPQRALVLYQYGMAGTRRWHA